MKRFILIICLCCIAFIVACTQEKSAPIENDLSENSDELRVVSVEDALQHLYQFLSETQMTKTVSGEDRTISSITPHYSDKPLTKSGDSIPDAYLVNFADESGFALLGANSSIAPIIAVIETGSTDWDKLLPDETIEPQSMDCIDPECDLLGPGMSPDQILTSCVIGALYGENIDNQCDTKSGPYAIDITPLLGSNFRFGQNVTYCHKGSNRFVTNGCASTAISMIIAYNNYPIMTVDYSLLNYSNCDVEDGVGYRYVFSDDIIFIRPTDYFTNGIMIPTYLSYSDKIAMLNKIDSKVIQQHGTPTITDSKSFTRTRYKLTSGVFYSLSNIIKSWEGTGTMPAAAENGLEDLGYINVSRTQSGSLSNGQINTIINMLSSNKPVLMCGWSFWELDESHYWVVDGIKKNDTETLICCNWGHNGDNDGWFASDCIRTDSRVSTKSSGANNAWNNIIVYSYNMSSTIPNRTVNTFSKEHRVTF